MPDHDIYIMLHCFQNALRIIQIVISFVVFCLSVCSLNLEILADVLMCSFVYLPVHCTCACRSIIVISLHTYIRVYTLVACDHYMIVESILLMYIFTQGYG